MLIDSLGQVYRQNIVEMVYFCSDTSAGKIQMYRVTHIVGGSPELPRGFLTRII